VIEWQRAILPTQCGGCSSVIAIGAPMKVFMLSAVRAGRRTKVRCEKCDGPAPPDLPEHVARAAITPLAMTRFKPDMLPLDFKQRQCREPGEDG
jgi:hypothetical protein